MATEVEQLYLQLELINIEEQMLKLQMLKRRRQRRRSGRCSVRPLNRPRLGTGEFTTWMNECTLDNFKCQRASSPYTAIQTGRRSNCRKLRSERTNHSPYGQRLRDV